MSTVLTAESTSAPPLPGGRIVIDEVDHDFAADAGIVPALRGVSLDIAPSEFVSLVGTSGCGKSTLLNIVAGLLTPTHGSVTIGRAVKEADGLPQRAYITQDDRLLPWRTAKQNVELPLQLHGVDREERAERAIAILRRVGLGDFADRRPHELSGGMRQRVSIAQSLVYHPAVLLMDEPFGALDAWTRDSLHDLLLDVQAELGTTVVLVTHDVGEALALSDRVVTLAPRPGRILAEYSLADRPRPRSHQTLRDEFFADVHQRIRADLGFTD
ncbi:ABC transporter ATP-binding protein [Agromyces intestinalis]|uniref:ABC transporter ATP-binding protein n=1 Tax=Agromyces intestinalis TaxID=2592652 RepID=A0A5C1YIG1_9MICO|nr:ABC transporter ATP-binding protein [Agromyces intestinalis]QEO14837.1 ABC transporter ATP-binding protein [Agromyces intestinalis]